ncbi:MAG: hypothetical protein PHP44_04130 [Kiritimatiellae bacterium]|nr:hypothetical protein [Kiritimatiellia bacterium]MDD4735276.1 hypothetical protein [Kiritimatiellia bacterium]
MKKATKAREPILCRGYGAQVRRRPKEEGFWTKNGIKNVENAKKRPKNGQKRAKNRKNAEKCRQKPQNSLKTEKIGFPGSADRLIGKWCINSQMRPMEKFPPNATLQSRTLFR